MVITGVFVGRWGSPFGICCFKHEVVQVLTEHIVTFVVLCRLGTPRCPGLLLHTHPVCAQEVPAPG